VIVLLGLTKWFWETEGTSSNQRIWKDFCNFTCCQFWRICVI
jgi:hypothetical protein